jgi:uncharacterized coiled-coil DUF342 family protein
MTPTEMHIDALMEKIKKLEAENARYIERIQELTTELEFYKNRVNKAWGE